MMQRSWLRCGALLACACALPAAAADYTVGPAGSGKQYTSLATLFAQVNLQPGDVVRVDGNATYTSSGSVGFRMDEDDGGAVDNPVRIIGVSINGKRPHLTMSSGAHVFKFERSNHVVLDNFEITSGGGGTNTCVFSEAHDVVLRNLVIHDCKAHGILAADHNSGSLTLEYSEIYNAGSGEQRHPVYVTADSIEYPDAVFRMQFNYIHDGVGGNLVKSRHVRNEIYSNWLEGSRYQEIELIGPDCDAWDGTPPNREGNSDVVGNVIIHTNSWSNVIRAGGDLNGRSRGLVRLVNNTILIDRPGTANAVMVQLGVKGLEMHNNVIHQVGGNPVIVRENTTADTPTCGYTDTRPWVDGVRRVHGGTNWVQTGATQVPSASEWMSTFKGSDPGFTGIAARQLRPLLQSPLRGNGNALPSDAPGVPFPQPLRVPTHDAPQRALLASGMARARRTTSGFSIGAFEPEGPILVQGSQPLIPGQAPAAAAQSMPASAPVVAVRTPSRMLLRPAPVVRGARVQASPACTSKTSTVRNGVIARVQAWWDDMFAPATMCDAARDR